MAHEHGADWFLANMQVEIVAIESISPDPANVRKHGKRNLDAIKASLRRFGQQKPIVVDGQGVVRAGNGTLDAAKSLGWKEIQIVRSTLSPSELTAFAVADNRTAELAEWDVEFLSQLLAQGDLGDVGFDDSEIRKLLEKPAKGEDEVSKLEAKFEVVVECRDEDQQKELFERFSAEGLTCRLFTL